MWSGQSTNIPDGWTLCNGQNGTPNLTDKFIIGAGAKYSPGNIGGEEKHTLTTNEMPSHSHAATLNLNGLTTSSAGEHTHMINMLSSWGDLVSPSGGGRSAYSMTGETRSSGSHTHTISGSGSVSISSAGSDTAHNNMPPYYALCFIMKL